MKSGRIAILFFSLLLLAFSAMSLSPGEKDEIVQIRTSYGDVYIRLYDDTPVHKANFIRLAKEGFFDSTLFHRVIENFMIQGGDPYSRTAGKEDSIGEGGPGYLLDAEFRENHFHKRGVIAAARNGDDVNPERKSDGSQFYIVQGKKFTDEELDKYELRVQKALKDSLWKYSDAQRTYYKTTGGTPWLDQQYTIFGEVIRGMEVVDKIAAVKRNKKDRPLEDIRMDVNIVEQFND